MDRQLENRPDLSSLYSVMLERFDRLEQLLTPKAFPDVAPGDEILDTRHIRILMKISDRTLLRRRNDGTLPYFKQGGKIYYLKSDVLRSLQQPDKQNNHK